MGKKNSPEAKVLRKAKVAAKRNAFSNPVERPDDCLRHFGFIPNDDFFKHSAIAWDKADMKLAMRSKANLIKCREEGLLKPIYSRTSDKDGVVYLSFFRTGNYKMDKRGGQQCFAMEELSNTDDDIYYIYRPTQYWAHCAGEKNTSQDKRDTYLPFMEMINTIMCPLSKLEELPEKGFSKEDIIKWGKIDESISPLNDEEMDNLLANSNEVALRENYVFNEDGLVMEEFAGNSIYEGETFYQLKKKDKTWEHCFIPLPFTLSTSGIIVAGGTSEANTFKNPIN